MDSNLKKLSMQVNVEDLLPASEKEKEYMVKMRPSTTAFQDGVRRLKKNKVAMVSFGIIILITLASIIIPMFWPYKYEAMLGITPGRPVDSSYNNLKPFEYSKTELKQIEEGEKIFPHVFGTDASGRDYFIRVVYGTRISMVILLASVLREPLGKALEGTVLEKIGSNIISLFIIFALLYWVSMSRLIRGQILSLREQEYVLAAQASGAKGGWVIRKHLIPNSISVIVISTALQIPNAIFTESYLSFLGLGVNAPMPSLGSLASDALNGLKSYPYRLVIPALVISLIVLSLNLFGDGLRDAFDPKLNG